MKATVVVVLALLALSAWTPTVRGEDVVDAETDTETETETEAAEMDSVLSQAEEGELDAFTALDEADQAEQSEDETVEEDEEAEDEVEDELEEADADELEMEAEAEAAVDVADAGWDKFHKALMSFLEEYKNAVEGAPDGKFKKLFGDLTAIRKASPMFTTCTSFVPKVLQAAQAAANWRVGKDPSASFFSRDAERLKKGIKANQFYACLPPVANSWQKYKTFDDWTKNDKTATYVALDDPKAPRPQPGDVFLLGFSAKHPTSKLLTTGMFSHIGFVTKVEQRKDAQGKPTGIEDWTVVAGGGGSRAQNREAVTESKMEVNTVGTRGHFVPVGNPSDPVKRYLAGWIPVSQLYKDGKAAKF